jgi:uncharacterized paraquat-inducible protein A
MCFQQDMYWSTSLLWGEYSTAPFFYSRSTNLSLLFCFLLFFSLRWTLSHFTVLPFSSSFAIVSSQMLVYFRLFSSVSFSIFFFTRCISLSVLYVRAPMHSNSLWRKATRNKKEYSRWVLVSVFLRKLSYNLTLALLVRECGINCGKLRSRC